MHDSQEVNVMAHVGRIEYHSKVWAWSKIMTDLPTKGLDTVTALAVDPSGSKLAVIGHKFERDINFIFVLDTATGSQVSGYKEYRFFKTHIK